MVSVCTNCKGLQKHLRGLDGGVQETETGSWEWLNTTLPSLRRSANGGCRACALLVNGILLHHDRFPSVKKEEYIKIKANTFDCSAPVERTAQDHLSVEVRWQEPRDEMYDGESESELGQAEGYPDLKLEFFTDQDGQSPFSAIGPGRLISENPLQDNGVSTARGMIKDCLSRHSRCRQPKPATLPKRVLDVLLGDSSKDIRLHEADFNNDERRNEFGEYLTLSYCYGSGTEVLKTTSENLGSHKQNIAWSTLPRTFQDAVVLTRALGFRYLWIDALCITQDDLVEKREESFKLGEIFSNSFLTIGATSASHSGEGLFQPKKQPFKIQGTNSKGSVSKIYVREQPTHYSFKAPFDEAAHMNDWELPFNTSVEANLQTPLLKRAWAYAERLLSPRVLHFTKSEMILECREGYSCECGRIDDSNFDSRLTDPVKQEFGRVSYESRDARQSMNGSVTRSSRADSLTAQLATTSLSEDGKTLNKRRDEALQLWSYIVTEYTARDLTYDDDRLLAISSVANALSRTLQSGYVAGQWTFSILGLLWYPNDTSLCRRPRESSINVPSWSWASVEGSPIFFDNSTAMDLACTASLGTSEQSSIWSPITGDTLNLTVAMATEVTFRADSPEEGEEYSFSLSKNGISVDFRPDISPPTGSDAIVNGETLTCVLVSMTFRSSIIGLVLQRSTSGPEIYRRVGRFECYDCQRIDSDEEAEDAEALFEHWFPEVEDMTKLEDGPKRTFVVV